MIIFLWFISLIVTAIGIAWAVHIYDGNSPIGYIGRMIKIDDEQYSIEINDYRSVCSWNILLNGFYKALLGMGYELDDETKQKFMDLIGDIKGK